MLRLCLFWALRAPVPSSVAVLGSLLRFCVTLLRAMLRYVSRKLLILKEFFEMKTTYVDKRMTMTSEKQIDQFLDAAWSEQGLSKNTLSAYRSDLTIFAAWLKKDLLTVDSENITKFLASRYKQGMTSRTTARILSSLRRFYGYFLREQYRYNYKNLPFFL